MVSAHGGTNIWQFSLATSEQAGSFASPGNVITVVAITPDGRQVLGGGWTGVLRRWDTVTGTPIIGDVPTERLADVVSDLESTEDALGITGDVNMIAAILASLTTTPPLSVALLGDWGAGKSSFMRQLRARMAALAEDSA